MASNAPSFYINTNRAFSPVRRYIWILTLLIGVGGQFWPLIGLLVPVIMAALILTSLFKGKYWCGNFCPHGSFFDNLLLPISRHGRIPGFLRSLPVVAIVLVFFLFNMGRRFWHVYAEIEPGAIWEQMGLIFSTTYLVVLIVGGLLAVAVSSRTWCQFCPMGTIQHIFYKLGKAIGLAQKTDHRVTIEHPELCHSCGKCARVCPMQLYPYLNFSENHMLEDEECIRCNTCVKNCPAGILHLTTPQEAEKIKRNASLDGFAEADYYEAQIKEIKEIKEDVRQYTFELLNSAQMIFTPGQFVLVEIDSNIKMFRAYSISASQDDHTEITITVKKLPDGYGTNLLFENFREGDLVTLKGPMGKDIRIDPTGKELMFISNGIGVTPFVSAVQSFFDYRHYNFDGKVTLLYGARYEEDLVYDDYFEYMARQNENLDYYKVLSRPRTDKYPKGYVTDVIKELSPSPETRVYICGTSAMANQAIEQLVAKGVPENNIFYEDFGL